MPMKFAAVFVLAYLLFGTVAGDWAMHGPTTTGYGRQLISGGAILAAFFLLGLRGTRRHSRFMGFSRWQWGVLPPLALAAGMVLRFYALSPQEPRRPDRAERPGCRRKQ